MVKILSQKEIKRIQTRERRRMSRAEEVEEVRRFFNNQAIARQEEEDERLAYDDQLMKDCLSVSDFEEDDNEDHSQFLKDDFISQEEYDDLFWWYDPD